MAFDSFSSASAAPKFVNYWLKRRLDDSNRTDIVPTLNRLSAANVARLLPFSRPRPKEEEVLVDALSFLPAAMADSP